MSERKVRAYSSYSRDALIPPAAGEGVAWLGYTYLFVRMLRNPSLYGASEAERESDPLLEQRRIDLIHSAATLLDKCGLLRSDDP